jgi:hypothetical protein
MKIGGHSIITLLIGILLGLYAVPALRARLGV